MCKKCLLIVVVLLLGASVASAKTVAYWRFDDMYNPTIDFSEGHATAVAAGNPMPDSDGRSVWRKAAHDWSGNGNDLTTFEYDDTWGNGYGWASDRWSSDVPVSQVPLTGIENKLSMEHTADMGCCPAAMTWSAGSNPSGVDLETWTPSAWTIEASFKLNEMSAFHTIVGRDGINVSDVHSMKAPLYLSVRPGGAVAIEFSTVDRQTYEAVSDAGKVKTDQWYAIVAVSDGETLSLYLDKILVAQTIGMTGATSIGIGEGAGGDNWAGTWTLGRGMWNGGHGDRVFGNIDEVRISDTALDPCQFLIPEPATILILGLGGLTLLRKRS